MNGASPSVIAVLDRQSMLRRHFNKFAASQFPELNSMDARVKPAHDERRSVCDRVLIRVVGPLPI
jgi:hypothetical protein